MVSSEEEEMVVAMTTATMAHLRHLTQEAKTTRRNKQRLQLLECLPGPLLV
jgi:hypothetical protein